MADPLGDRMKEHEQREAGRKVAPGLPICARIDGRTFSTWTRGLARPYDERLSRLMIATTVALVDHTGAAIGYTQSDEISLVWLPEAGKLPFFGGKFQKMVSSLASYATAEFNRRAPAEIPERADRPAMFDARVWTVPDLQVAAEVLLWRQRDALKNSVSMAAREFASHRALLGKTSAEKRALLLEHGVDWMAYPAHFRAGVFVRARRTEQTLTPADLAALPERHEARRTGCLTFSRRVIEVLDLPDLRTLSPNQLFEVSDG